MQTLETNKLGRLELSEKSLTSFKHGDIIIKPMSQTREKWDSLFETVFCRVENVDLPFEWSKDAIVLFLFFFILSSLDPTVRQCNWIRKT